MKPTVAIIQARMTSTRLPGKVVKPLLGLPSIVFMVRRALKAASLDRVIVATSTDPSDDALEQVLSRYEIETFRGSLVDVLDRFYQCATWAKAATVVRLTGDCPLVDADLIDAVAGPVRAGTADYASNIEPATYPDGLDVEAMSFDALGQAWREASVPSDREHVTPFLRRQPGRFRAAAVSGLSDLSALRWTVDHPDDFQHVQALIEAAGARACTEFDRFDLYRVIERNAALRQGHHHRNEGYQKSLHNDPKDGA